MLYFTDFLEKHANSFALSGKYGTSPTFIKMDFLA